MQTVDIYEAKTQLSKLIDQAAQGHDIVIARSGKPVARLTKPVTNKRVIRFGVLKGKVSIADDFDVPLPADALAAFEGK